MNDHSGNTAGFKKDQITAISETNPDYSYDDHGNLIADHTKEITSITYNHLNLPTKVTFHGTNKFIEYLYTATGQKVQKRVMHQDSTSTTRYLHGFQYYDNVLQFFHTPEGYVKNTPDDTGAPSFDYVYQYKDHLGNVRVNYAQNPQTGELEILEENHYYPFGLQHTNYNSDLLKLKREEQSNEKSLAQDTHPTNPFDNPGYKYKFNGMEMQEEFGTVFYDFGARNYDPAIGRWMNVDPLADSYLNLSPYTFVANNPLLYIDPDGKKIIIGSHITGQRYEYRNGNLYIVNTNQLYTGNESFLITNRDAIKTLDEASTFFYGNGDKLEKGGIIHRLVESDKVYSIGYSEGVAGVIPNTNLIRIDHSSKEILESVPTENGFQKLIYAIIIAHELGHVFSFHGDFKNTNTWFKMIDVNGVEREIILDEIFAMYFENIFRELLGLPRRIAYNDNPKSKFDYKNNQPGSLRTLQKSININLAPFGITEEDKKSISSETMTQMIINSIPTDN